jgi:hypothetical protein
MSEREDSTNLSWLLSTITDRNSADWERGWSIFLQRYKALIYGVVMERVRLWNIYRVSLDISEYVNDVAGHVLFQLVDNDSKDLKNFKKSNDEGRFIYWLKIFASRTSNRYIKTRHILDLFDSGDIAEFISHAKSVEQMQQWELYDGTVSILRDAEKKRNKYIERNINIFMLYIWGDFSPDMIAALPGYRNLGHRVLDNVINRYRNVLQKNKNI